MQLPTTTSMRVIIFPPAPWFFPTSGLVSLETVIDPIISEYICFAYREILHDPQNYQDPWKFDPDRFINTLDKEIDLVELVFGFGRR